MIGIDLFRSGATVGVLTALLAFGASSTRAEDTRAAESREQSGAALYQQYCGACHGADADGKGPMAPVLREPPPDLTRIASRRDGVFPEAEIARIINGSDPIVSHGTSEMPVWGKRFTEGMPPSAAAEAERRGQAILLVSYLRSIQVTDSPAGP